MLVRHRHAPTTAFVSIYRKDMREIVINAYVHTVSISLTNYDTFRHFHVFILPPHILSLVILPPHSVHTKPTCNSIVDKLEFMGAFAMLLRFMSNAFNGIYVAMMGNHFIKLTHTTHTHLRGVESQYLVI